VTWVAMLFNLFALLALAEMQQRTSLWPRLLSRLRRPPGSG
jgi:hypothetical protein